MSTQHKHSPPSHTAELDVPREHAPELPSSDGVAFSWARYAATRLKQFELAHSGAATLRCFVPSII